MNLVLQVMSGVTLAGLAEGMALADRAGLQQKDVMEIMELTSLACPLMIEKGKGKLFFENLVFASILCVLYKVARCGMRGLGSRSSSCSEVTRFHLFVLWHSPVRKKMLVRHRKR